MRPGTDILISDSSPGGGGELDTGQAFFVGEAERGSTDVPQQLRSLSHYERLFGVASGGPISHRSVRAFFSERGSNLRFLRLVGPTATPAAGEVGDLKVSASSAGTWGNDVRVAVVSDVSPLLAAAKAQQKTKVARRQVKAGVREGEDNGEGNGNGEDPPVPIINGNGVRVVVTEAGQVVERSRRLHTVGEAVDWSMGSDFVRATSEEDPEDSLDPVAAVPLTGGKSDSNITPAVLRAGLKRFDYTLGFAQVAYPGETRSTMHGEILAHCDANRRPGLLDLNDIDDPTIAADANALNGAPGSRFAAALAPRWIYPGPVLGTTMLVPYSAVFAGIIARADATTGNPNESAAGANGESLIARGILRGFDNETRELLNDLGVTLPRVMRSNLVRSYGSRTVAGPDDPNWLWFPGSRTILAIAHECDVAAEEFVHRQIDGNRRLFSRLEVALGGICLDYFQMGALYGDVAEEAFSVDTTSVNTTATIAAGEVHAVVRVRVSPPGEWVVIEIQKTPLAQAV
jgi:hypothetical protein